MRFFKRPAPADPSSAIEAFWHWWATDRERVAAAIGDGTVQSFVSVISDHVRAIHPHLAWELSKGTTAQHALIVTPEGDPSIRHLAAAWLAQAPAPDARWRRERASAERPARRSG